LFSCDLWEFKYYLDVMPKQSLETTHMSTKNVFISHSANQDISALRKLVEAQGGTIQGSYDMSAPFVSAIDRVIESASAVVVVLGPGSDVMGSTNVLFELGLAVGLRKPLLVIVSPGARLPSSLQNVAYLTSDVMDSPVLELGIKRFLNDAFNPAKSSRSITPAKKDSPPFLPAIRELIPKIREARNGRSAISVERLASAVLGASGVNVVEEMMGPSRGADFAIWSDSLQSSVLVEIKAGSFSVRQFKDAFDLLARQVRATDAGSGLLLYLDRSGVRFSKPDLWVPNVLWFDLEDFAKSLLNRSFADILVQQRNRIVHGLVE
jgi:hypothetical protein